MSEQKKKSKVKKRTQKRKGQQADEEAMATSRANMAPDFSALALSDIAMQAIEAIFGIFPGLSMNVVMDAVARAISLVGDSTYEAVVEQAVAMIMENDHTDDDNDNNNHDPNAESEMKSKPQAHQEISTMRKVVDSPPTVMNKAHTSNISVLTLGHRRTSTSSDKAESSTSGSNSEFQSNLRSTVGFFRNETETLPEMKQESIWAEEKYSKIVKREKQDTTETDNSGNTTPSLMEATEDRSSDNIENRDSTALSGNNVKESLWAANQQKKGLSDDLISNSNTPVNTEKTVVKILMETSSASEISDSLHGNPLCSYQENSNLVETMTKNEVTLGILDQTAVTDISNREANLSCRKSTAQPLDYENIVCLSSSDCKTEAPSSINSVDNDFTAFSDIVTDKMDTTMNGDSRTCDQAAVISETHLSTPEKKIGVSNTTTFGPDNTRQGSTKLIDILSKPSSEISELIKGGLSSSRLVEAMDKDDEDDWPVLVTCRKISPSKPSVHFSCDDDVKNDVIDLTLDDEALDQTSGSAICAKVEPGDDVTMQKTSAGESLSSKTDSVNDQLKSDMLVNKTDNSQSSTSISGESLHTKNSGGASTILKTNDVNDDDDTFCLSDSDNESVSMLEKSDAVPYNPQDFDDELPLNNFDSDKDFQEQDSKMKQDDLEDQSLTSTGSKDKTSTPAESHQSTGITTMVESQSADNDPSVQSSHQTAPSSSTLSVTSQDRSCGSEETTISDMLDPALPGDSTTSSSVAVAELCEASTPMQESQSSAMAGKETTSQQSNSEKNAIAVTGVTTEMLQSALLSLGASADDLRNIQLANQSSHQPSLSTSITKRSLKFQQGLAQQVGSVASILENMNVGNWSMFTAMNAPTSSSSSFGLTNPTASNKGEQPKRFGGKKKCPTPSKKAKMELKVDCTSYREARNLSVEEDSGHESPTSPVSELPSIPGEDEDRVNDAILCCDGCETASSYSKCTQCNHGHIVCTSCLEEEVKQVMSTDKLSLMCPSANCKDSISLDMVSRLLPSLVVSLLKDNIHQKEIKASANVINNMDGIVSCPSCNYTALMDKWDVKFNCGSTNCTVECCRYCRAPWSEEHIGCQLLSCVGMKCLKDNTKLPVNWAPMPASASKPTDKLYREVIVPLASQEGKCVSFFYSQTSKNKITGIWRIQNKKLWETYVLKRKHMVEELGEMNLMEKHLFHGTREFAMQHINGEGFDLRVQTVNGEVYGKGIYFSPIAAYSERYTSVSSSKYMYIARVLCGRTTRGRKGMTRPPHDPNGRLFDSCVDNPERPNMYIIFDNGQCYPEYIVKFHS